MVKCMNCKMEEEDEKLPHIKDALLDDTTAGSTWSVPRTVILPISTREIGFVIRNLVSELNKLELEDVDVYNLTNALYRISLLQLDLKIAYAMKVQLVHNIEMDTGFSALSDYIAAVGFWQDSNATYLPRFAALCEEVICDPVNVRFNQLYNIVNILADECTPEYIRKGFYNKNPIPGAIWRQSEVGILLDNKDDIMFCNYNEESLRKDIEIVKAAVEKLDKVHPDAVSNSRIEWENEGTCSQLVSTAVIPFRCPSYDGDNLKNIIGEYDHFWSPEKMTDSEFSIGAACLFEDVQSTNPTVRGSAIALVGTMVMYKGNTLMMFFDSEQPALKSQVQAEFSRNLGEKPPKLVRRLKKGENIKNLDAGVSGDIADEVWSSYINDLKLIKLDNEIVGRPNVERLRFSKTKYPITGSRCFVLTMFTEYTNNLDLAYQNKYEFLKNEMKVGEI
uniref:Uncharacterized protein n=1 Tax=Glossina morsitans morsitans TaxID=37546 RepID=A0A1B0FNL0_GLOMM